MLRTDAETLILDSKVACLSWNTVSLSRKFIDFGSLKISLPLTKLSTGERSVKCLSLSLILLFVFCVPLNELFQ